jgi:1-acyl-sn-glycerol-3-phosphate acyltransferase
MSEETKAAAHGRGAAFEPNPKRTLTYRLLRWLLSGLMRIYFSPRVEGPGKIPSEGPVIIAPVHRSIIDFGFAIFLTDRKMFFIAKDSLWKFSLLGRFLLAMGAFPVHRESADRAALNHAESVLAAGEVLVLFPEGTRQEGPIVGDILEGAAFLAARTGATIVPVGIGGSAKAMPVGKRLPRRSKVTLFVGEPLPAPQRNEKGRVARSVVHETTVALRAALQDDFDRASA